MSEVDALAFATSHDNDPRRCAPPALSADPLAKFPADLTNKKAAT